MANTVISSYGFVSDPGSVQHSVGGQIDWAKVATARKNGDGNKEIKGGTVVVRTPAGKFVPRADVVSVTSLTDNGSSVVTVVATAHGFADGDTVVIAGANEARFNGTFTITYVNADTFTYVPASTSAGAATGTLVASYQAYGILATFAQENAPEDALSGYGVLVGGRVYENILQDSTGTPKVLPAAYKSELAATGAYFGYEQYEDSRLA